MNSKKMRLNLLDVALLLTIVFSITGYIFAKAEKIPLNKVIEGKENIGIEILIPDVFSKVTNTPNSIFETGKETAITIRNRPYTKLTIINLESKPKQIVIPLLNGPYKIINDPTKPDVKDYFVTVKDTALKTKDGYVIGGNKIKTGNQIELEGFNYRLNGKVVNVYPIK